MKKYNIFLLCSSLIISFLYSACINPYSKGELFEKFIQPRFPTEYYIYPGQFTAEEVQTIHQGYQNWEPIIQRLTGTNFHFRCMGYAAHPFDPNDTVHVVLKKSLEANVAGRAHLLGGPGTSATPGGDIAINEDKGYHTADQYHLWGLRMIASPCLEAVVTHEVGHLMGLIHSDNSEDIMYPNETVTNCSTRKPSENDERALEALYIRYLENFDFTKNFDSSDSESLVYSN